jgi:secreted PhoX family phosphatase
MKANLPIQRRQFLNLSAQGMGAFFLGAHCTTLFAGGVPEASGMFTQISDFSELQPADENGIRLPKGFRSKVVARSSQSVVSTSDYKWHGAPDGGACFATDDGGWVYASNSEIENNKGGVGCIRFNANGDIIDAYPILQNTNNNCAGGKTPWNTWLSCEEVDRGRVFECDPYGVKEAQVRPALGYFEHEAVTVDEYHQHLFLTEDDEQGNFYRFIPSNKFPNLDAGELQVAELIQVGDSYKVNWHKITDPQATITATRMQVPQATQFNGGEGIQWSKNHVYFTTKGDNRVWDYDTREQTISILYDIKTADNSLLSGVDNLTITASGDVLVAEDGGDMQLVLLTASGSVIPVMQVVGQDFSEICGPAFSPDFQRLYFSSQTGPNDRDEEGIIYEVSNL